MSLITTRQAVHHFIDDIIRSSPAATLIADWRIEKEDIISIITNHFHSIGIYYVEPPLREVLRKDILFQLKNSPSILNKVRKAEELEKRRSSRRYKDNLT